MKALGYAATAVGALIVIVALAADYIGLGDATVSEIGVRQATAIALGAIILVVGVILILRQRSKQDDSKESD